MPQLQTIAKDCVLNSDTMSASESLFPNLFGFGELLCFFHDTACMTRPACHS